MPRPERPLGPEDSALLGFAADLRRLREKAGKPTYRELSKQAHYSVTVLSDAASGHKLPTLAVTLAYVEACGGRRRGVAAAVARAVRGAVGTARRRGPGALPGARGVPGRGRRPVLRARRTGRRVAATA